MWWLPLTLSQLLTHDRSESHRARQTTELRLQIWLPPPPLVQVEDRPSSIVVVGTGRRHRCKEDDVHRFHCNCRCPILDSLRQESGV
ncbi:hypothetical protein PVAP13_3NG216432 [Panicum virgatum]|uniref:Uncharacterized protein n=1 Tax=Panicum virgatum TaxID=38727 RepID=A0A8T0UIC4_PANVG|nr:hypothetical protein PVAP13_3NG216432 [Panicum virgatum]KAG2620653.1 hypothetical protein PVAP13_3NG216432 [Panicum virgatum]